MILSLAVTLISITTSALAYADDDVYTAMPIITRQQSSEGAEDFKWQGARCTQWGDSLNPGMATGRIDWTLKCYDERGVNISEEIERDPLRASSFIDELYRVQSYSTIVRMAKRENVNRPGGPHLYPTFGMWNPRTQEPVNPDQWQAPTERAAPCNFPRPEYSVVGICVEGCFAQGQSLRFEDGERTLEFSSAQNISRISTLQSGSTLERQEWGSSRIRNYVETLGRGDQEVVRIETDSGRNLTVTLNHPILTSAGTLVEARNLRSGDLLVTDQGEWTAVTSLTTDTYFGKVYNVAIHSADPIHHLVSAGGIVNGSSYFQNEGNDWINRLLLRANLRLE